MEMLKAFKSLIISDCVISEKVFAKKFEIVEFRLKLFLGELIDSSSPSELTIYSFSLSKGSFLNKSFIYRSIYICSLVFDGSKTIFGEICLLAPSFLNWVEKLIELSLFFMFKASFEVQTISIWFFLKSILLGTYPRCPSSSMEGVIDLRSGLLK